LERNRFAPAAVLARFSWEALPSIRPTLLPFRYLVDARLRLLIGLALVTFLRILLAVVAVVIGGQRRT